MLKLKRATILVARRGPVVVRWEGYTGDRIRIRPGGHGIMIEWNC